MDEFRRAGVVHIVVLSGYNIVIIAEFLRKLVSGILARARSTFALALAPAVSILGIFSFVIMTGAEATVVRASIMVFTLLLAHLVRRRYIASRALLVAGFLMLVHNPKILLCYPSFQLSFIATCGIIFITPIIEKYLSKVTTMLGLRTIVSTTLATQIAVLPLLMYSMGDVSLVALPANILILFFIPYTMFFGFVATLLAYISYVVALPFALISHTLLLWILGVSSVLGNLPFASMQIPAFSPILLLLMYVVGIIFVKRFGSSSHKSAS